MINIINYTDEFALFVISASHAMLKCSCVFQYYYGCISFKKNDFSFTQAFSFNRLERENEVLL